MEVVRTKKKSKSKKKNREKRDEKAFRPPGSLVRPIPSSPNGIRVWHTPGKEHVTDPEAEAQEETVTSIPEEPHNEKEEEEERFVTPPSELDPMSANSKEELDLPSVPPVTASGPDERDIPVETTPIISKDTPIEDKSIETIPTISKDVTNPPAVSVEATPKDTEDTINVDNINEGKSLENVGLHTIDTTPIINNETEPPESVDEFRPSAVTESLRNISPEVDLMNFEETSATQHREASTEQTTVEETVDRQHPTAVVTVETTSQPLPTAPSLKVTPLSTNTVEVESEIRYPRLDSLIAASANVEADEELSPFTEEDLSLMYVNPQLVANQEFVENFMRECDQSHHPLYELLNQYLKARLSQRTAEAKLEGLKTSYSTSMSEIWRVELKTLTSQGRCTDNSKVTHTHSYKFAEMEHGALQSCREDLKQLRDCLEEEISMRSYSTQLAHIHVEYYLHQLLQSVPLLVSLPPNSPVTGYIPDTPPGCLDHYTAELRNCISVLFMFERRPVRDKTFSNHCKEWLDLMLNALLRLASLPDHLFVLNHLLRCPPGVGRWGVKYLQPLSPVTHQGSLRPSSGTDGSHGYQQDVEYSLSWSSSFRDCQWGGAILDSWVTMLSTLLMPISGRKELLCMLGTPPPSDDNGGVARQESQRWTFVEEDLEEDITEDSFLDLKESDYIALLDQFPFNEIFKYILQAGNEGSYSVTKTSSYQMMQLLAFCTRIVRILGTVFSSLRETRYKEFVKQVGRTVRQVVHYVADHWLNYKVHKERQGDTPSTTPTPESESGPYRYSLHKLQVEFDQFVLRATQWILTAHKLGAWQFMADMPYSSVSLLTLWKILWTLYHYQFSTSTVCVGRGGSGQEVEGGGAQRRGSILTERLDLDLVPETSENILSDIRDPFCHAKFVDVLMKTYTSEAVFLLTTFVNMARSRTVEDGSEMKFVDTIAEEIFQFTQVEEFSRDAYSRTGCNLLGTIASVHPFIISTLLRRVSAVVSDVGENCILLFKELPIHLWVPSKGDMSTIYSWLISTPLSSHENSLARLVVSGLNWGVREADVTGQQGPSRTLILPLALHRDVALCLVEASCHHLSSLPGGFNYSPSASSLRKYASSIRSMMSTEQSDFANWLWEAVLMLKLHPTQLSLISILPPSPSGRHSATSHTNTNPQEGRAKNPSVYKQEDSLWERMDDTVLPNLKDSSVNRFDMLRDSVEKEGILASYVALCLTSLGSDAEEFLSDGVPMLNRLIEQGYYLPVLRVIGNVVPIMFRHRKLLINDQNFCSLVHSVANADVNSSSIKDILTWNTPTPLIIRRLSAMITTHLHHCGKTPADQELILLFWMEALFSIPHWIKERSVLYLLNGLCISVYGNKNLEQILVEQLFDQYQFLQPLQQKNRRLISSMTSSMLSMVGQEGGPPSLFSNITATEYPWLCYYALRAEQDFEQKEGIWKTLLTHMKKDPKISLDNALKKSLAELHHSGAHFPSSHLCVFRWGVFAASLDHTIPIAPLVWQRFFSLYLQRALLDHSMPERGSFGLRLFSSNQSQSLRRDMKKTLSNITKALNEEVNALNREDSVRAEEAKEKAKLRNFLPACLSFYQTLKLWIHEPRLHEETLHLPGLPKQYDSGRLEAVFKPQQNEWVELVKVWDINEMIRVMVFEWGQVASYQLALPCETEGRDTSPDTAAARIQKRLHRQVTQIPPSSFQLPPAPFSLVSSEILLSKDALLPSVINDAQFIAQQARIFTERVNTLGALDAEYISAVPDLYSNIDRQFHVNVPCRSKLNRNHRCQGPAPIVFRFKEMTPHAHWEERLKQNRLEHTELVRALSSGVPNEMCQAVARTEHAVGELAKLSAASNTEALSSGVALFYEILRFITMDTERFPPSQQFFTSCIEILGQEFIQNDASQTSSLLNIILHQRAVSRLLSPLFIPNLSPAQFLIMYASVGTVAVRDAPALAFSVLSKFNIPQWLNETIPTVTDSRILLDHIFTGIKQCGSADTLERKSLLEVYITHMKHMTEHQFPLLYNETLFHLVTGTDSVSIFPQCWDQLLNIVSPVTSSSSQSRGEACRLGLQLVQESAKFLADHYTQKRLFTKESLYNLVPHSFLTSIGQYMYMLGEALVVKSNESIDLGNMFPNQALTEVWHAVIDMFTPWVFPLHHTESTEAVVLDPCQIKDTALMNTILQMFTGLVSMMQNAFKIHGESTLALLWSHYFNHLTFSSAANQPGYVLQCYHINFVKLPWQQYRPTLKAMDLMLKLKLDKSYPPACFVFLGDILPMINWKSLVEMYSSDESPDIPVKFHIILIQLLVMLAATDEVMSKKEAKLPYLLVEAKSYGLHYIDANTFRDILLWVKDNCQCLAVLQPGSPLSNSLRLLKAVASFPCTESTDHNLLKLHQNGWEKRYCFMRLIVELLAKASHEKDSHSLSYADAIVFMIQSVIDISIFEPDTCYSEEVILLLQEILHVLNICDPSQSFQHSLVEHLSSCLTGIPNAQYICLPTVTAACRAVVSIPLMGSVIENALIAHFKSLPVPEHEAVQLPSREDGYGWREVQAALSVPEAAQKELIEYCITECACLSLHVQLMQMFPLCTSIDQEYTIICDVVQWCTKLKPKVEQEAGTFLIWEKVFNLILRQIRYGGNITRIIPHLTTLANVLQRNGEDKATEGLLGAIGLGKKSTFSLQFRLISRVIATFILCQLPMDSIHKTIMRVLPNAPGHIKTPRHQSSSVLPTKQADQAHGSLEALLGNKNYIPYKEHILYSLEFIDDSRFSLFDTLQLLMYLIVNLYCNERSLDVLRVIKL